MVQDSFLKLYKLINILIASADKSGNTRFSAKVIISTVYDSESLQ